MRKVVVVHSLILVAIGLAAATLGVLLSFPQNPLVWQAATWTLVGAVTGLLVLVLVSGCILVMSRAARTWPSVSCFLAGVVTLLAVAVRAF